MKQFKTFFASFVFGAMLTAGATLANATVSVSADGLCDEVCGCPGSGADCCSSGGVTCYKGI